nr:receptor-like protein EIX1 [Ipomoea batatas]
MASVMNPWLLPISTLSSFFIFVLMINKFGFSCGNPNPICRNDEKQALLCFKKGLIINDPGSWLSSWVDGDDCCTKWGGVVCNNVTGRVTALHLANLSSGGELSPCLLELRQLSHLDLSGNDFEGIPIPGFLGSLLNLEYLDLSEAGFQGIIPHQLGNLTRLHTLRISGWGLKDDSLEWLSSLSNLQQLDLSSVDLSKALNWVEVTSALPSLNHLLLSGCNLANISSSLHHNNYSSLLVLDLSSNKFNYFVPKWIFSLNTLVSLDLSYNKFLGPLPGPWNFSSLENLDISYNHISGSLPMIFGGNKLQNLVLSGNQFSGAVPTSIGRMERLRYLDLSENDFSSSIPSWIL